MISGIQKTGCVRTLWIRFALVWVSLVLVPSPSQAEKELGVSLVLSTTDGAQRIYVGAPLRLVVNLNNLTVQRAAEARRDAWRAEVLESAASGRPAQSTLEPFRPPAEMTIDVGTDQEWRSRVSISMQRVDVGSIPVLAGRTWSDWEFSPRSESSVVLGMEPGWFTVAVPPDVVSGLGAGRYSLEASYPGASTGRLEFDLAVPETSFEVAQARLEAAAFYEQSGDFERCLQSLPRPEDHRYPKAVYWLRGFALEKSGDFAGARDAFLRFLELEGPAERVRDRRGEIARERLRSIEVELRKDAR